MRRLVYCLFLASLAAGRSGAQELVCAGTQPSTSPAASIAAKIVPAQPSVLQQHRGQFRALILFAKFADEAPALRSAPDFASQILDPERVGSLTHFYRAMSEGQFELSGTVLSRRYTSQRSAAAYVNTEPGKMGRYGEFVREVLQQADADVDFTRFDNDGPDGVPNSGDDDGVVDYLFVSVLSTPRGFIVGGATGIATLGLNDPYTTRDRGIKGSPIRVLGGSDHGSFGGEGTFSQTVGTMAHEFGHALGLPDLYDLNYKDPENDSAGVGRWCLMGWGAHGWNGDDGPNPFSAWCLKELGWIGPDNERLVEVTGEKASLEVAVLHQGGQVYEIPLPPAAKDLNTIVEEYLLLEQRTRSGSYYDRHLPGEGLLVWHIRPQYGANGDERAKEVDLVCADGLYQDAGYPLGRRADGKDGLDNLDFWAHNDEYARAHNGNVGDATDPFDGVRFTRFEKSGNPSIDATGGIPDQATGPGLRMKRQGERMRVEVEPLRWAGTIRQEVHWAGEVLVDGDVQVAPEGRLVIHPATQVLFAGSDRLRSGLDPSRSELDIQGELILKALGASSNKNSVRPKVTFEAQYPGQNWYGIVVNPARPSRIEVPESSYEMRDDEHGIFLPGAPPEARGQVLKQVRMVDVPGLETAGNGDGHLNPGETFQCVIELDNWSLTSYEDVVAELSWKSPLVALPEKAFVKSQVSEPSGFYPGTQLRIPLSALNLSPEAPPGEPIDFTLKLKHRGNRDWKTETVSFAVEGRYPEHQAQFAVPGRSLRGESVQVEPEQAVQVQTLIQGDIAGAELVLRSVPGLESLAEIPMIRKPNRLGRRVFEGTMKLPATGLYQARLRLRSAGGATVFSPAALYLWATPLQGPLPLLVFEDEEDTEGQKEELRVQLEQITAELGQEFYLVEAAPRQAPLYQVLLPHYQGTQAQVLWLGDYLDQDAQAQFRAFLEGGGRLGICSRRFAASGGSTASFLSELAGVQKVTNAGTRQLRSLYAEEMVQFRADYNKLELLPPAEPVLLDDRQQVAGLRLAAQGYRLVYLAFDLLALSKTPRQHLLESTLAFLRDQVQQASIEVPGREVSGGAAILPAGQWVLVRAQAGSGAVQASLSVRDALSLMKEVDEVAMRRKGQGFEISFRVPEGQGQYYFSLKLRDAQGKAMFNTAGLRVLGLEAEQPVLVLLDQPLGNRDKDELHALFADQAERLGMRATTLDQRLVSDGELYQALLRRYLGQGQMVIWLGEEMDGPTQEAFRAFLEGGGKLMLISSKLTFSKETEKFMREMVHVTAQVLNNSTAQSHKIRTTGALESPAVEMQIPHGVLDLAPPALPVLWEEQGKVAGLRVDTGKYRLVYLPFDLVRVGQDKATALAGPLLEFLHRGEPEGAALAVEGEQSTGLTLVAPGRPVALSLRAPRGIAEAGAVALKWPGMDLAAQVVLAPRAGGSYAGQLTLPATGQYLLMARLSRGGQSFFSGQSVQVAPFLFPPQHQALVFVDERYSAGEREALKVDLAEALGRVELQNDFVDLAPSEGGLYSTLLERYLGADKLVVWLGRELDSGAQDLFRRFVERGGRLFMASGNFQRIAGSAQFLNQVFRIRQVASTSFKGDFARAGEEFSFRYYPLTLEAQAVSALADKSGGVAGVYLDTGFSRTAYFSLDLKNVVSRTARQNLFAAAFAYLHQNALAPAQVQVKSVLAPGPVAVLGPLVPQVVVFNTGRQRSAAARVGYQILRGEQVLISVDRPVMPLEPGAEFQLGLPPWVPGVPVDLRIRFGVKNGTGEWGYLPPQPLRLVEALSPFAEVALPGEGSAGNGAGFFDCDNDGDLDLYLVRRGEANQLYRNEGEAFSEQARDAGLADKGWGRGLALGDWDADGDVDLFLVNEEQDHLFRNEGGGLFAEVTGQVAADSSSSLADEGSGRSAGFFDSDNDGDLDLYLVNSSGPNRLFVNEGGRFAERAAALGVADEGTGKGLALADWDGDGDVDLFVAIQNGGSRLYQNDGGRFSPVNETLGLILAEGEIGPAFGDYDNDGDLDLFVANEWRANQLWRNEGGRSFALMADSLGQKSTGAGWGDFDNDGDLDLLTTSVSTDVGGDQLHQNRGQEPLVPVGALVNLSPASNGRGLSFADYDGDGDLDAFVADASSSRLYRNEGNSARWHWLEVDLAGPSPNRQGLGARVEVVAGGRRQQQELFAAFGYASQGPARLHLGLGRAAQVDTLKVRWPDGAQSALTRLAADQRVEVRHPALGLAGKMAGQTAIQAGLGPGYPNPFNSSTLIRFQTALAGEVELEIYDLLGQRVRSLAGGELPPGTHQRLWDGRDQRGLPVASGVYFCRLHTGGQFFSQRLLLLK